MSTGIDHTYRYAYASSLDTIANSATLSLATSSRQQENPYFFNGRMRQPRRVAHMLLVLSQVVRTHFFQPRPPLMDPVLTSSESMLRLEGFSGCCGVYVRADLPATLFEGDVQGRGTTNVDFNTPMRSALARIQNSDAVQLSVGKHEVALSTSDDRVIEKKVKLPIRWIKGFSEVQAYQPSLSLRYEIAAPEALRFMRTLKNAGIPKRPSYVTQTGRTMRLSQREKPDAVQLHGTHRIKVIEPLLPMATHLRIWADAGAGTSAWEVVYDEGSFFLMISPEVYRGFSGEGQILNTLASGIGQDLVSYVHAKLNWQPQIDSIALAGELNTHPDKVNAALAILGTRGLAGYDIAQQSYFHRELPFDIDKVETLQPRLKSAKKLLVENKVRIQHRLDRTSIDLIVQGTDVSHIVRLRTEHDHCTCPWFSRYQGDRGVCKHILAARMYVANTSSLKSISPNASSTSLQS